MPKLVAVRCIASPVMRGFYTAPAPPRLAEKGWDVVEWSYYDYEFFWSQICIAALLSRLHRVFYVVDTPKVRECYAQLLSEECI